MKSKVSDHEYRRRAWIILAAVYGLAALANIYYHYIEPLLNER